MNIRVLGASFALLLSVAPLLAEKPAAPTPAPTPAAAPEQLPEARQEVEPKDGKWLRDKEGREYFVIEIPRVEGEYIWLDEKHTRVRTWVGTPYDVASATKTAFRVKIYRTEPPVPVAKPKETETPALTEHPHADRLELVDVGKGLPTRGQWRQGFVVYDFDRDGKLDIVHGMPRRTSSGPIVFVNKGNGTWAKETLSTDRPASVYDYGAVAVADFNGDGRPDVAVASHLKGIAVLVDNGKGAYAEWSRGIYLAEPDAKSPSGFTSIAIAAADWNGDGRPDLVALGEGPKLALSPGEGSAPSTGMKVFINNGDGSWGSVNEARTGNGIVIHGLGLAVGDLDGDGHPDAVLASNVLGLSQIIRWQKADGSWDLGSVELPAKVCFVTAVGIDDLDKDGRPDLLLGELCRQNDNWVTSIDGYFGKPERTFERRELFAEAGRGKVTAIAAGDVDGDSRRDIAALTGDGRTLLLLGDATGGWTREDGDAPKGFEGCQGSNVIVADLDGDGRGEIVESFAGESSATSIALGLQMCGSQGGLRELGARPKEVTPPSP